MHVEAPPSRRTNRTAISPLCLITVRIGPCVPLFAGGLSASDEAGLPVPVWSDVVACAFLLEADVCRIGVAIECDLKNAIIETRLY